MKKLIRENIKVIIAFIIGVVISSTTIYAYSFQSSDVEHTNSDGTTTSVETALNSLYTLHNSGNAAASNILSGKTALSGGSLLTGTMPNYSSSTAQSCTTANTSNKLYVKPVNDGYYSSNSSFNTGINYNPKGTGGSASTSGTTVTSSSTNITLNGSDLTLDSGSKITIPAGYYSNSINVSSGGTSTIKSKEKVYSAANPKTFSVEKDSYYIIAYHGNSGDYWNGITGATIISGNPNEFSLYDLFSILILTNSDSIYINSNYWYTIEKLNF